MQVFWTKLLDAFTSTVFGVAAQRGFKLIRHFYCWLLGHLHKICRRFTGYEALVAENTTLITSNQQLVTEHAELDKRHQQMISENEQVVSKNKALSQENRELKKMLDNQLGHHFLGFENYKRGMTANGDVFLADFKTVKERGAEPTRICILCAKDGVKTLLNLSSYEDEYRRKGPWCSTHHRVTEANC